MGATKRVYCFYWNFHDKFPSPPHSGKRISLFLLSYNLIIPSIPDRLPTNLRQLISPSSFSQFKLAKNWSIRTVIRIIVSCSREGFRACFVSSRILVSRRARGSSMKAMNFQLEGKGQDGNDTGAGLTAIDIAKGVNLWSQLPRFARGLY